VIAERAVAIRAALHTAEIESSGDKVAEIAMHIGARVMDQAGEAR
jgi:hypothetical protein